MNQPTRNRRYFTAACIGPIRSRFWTQPKGFNELQTVLAEEIFLYDSIECQRPKTANIANATEMEQSAAGNSSQDKRPLRKTLDHCEPPYCLGLSDLPSILQE
jgi:hypothetical protein